MEASLGLSSEEIELTEEAISKIPKVDTVVEKALKDFEKIAAVDEIKSNFSKALETLEHLASEVYFNEEKSAFNSLIGKWLFLNRDKLKNDEDAKKALFSFAKIVRFFEFRTGQMRKARAGRTFEKIVEYSLKKIGISCEKPYGQGREILKRIDIVIPSQSLALEKPDQAFFLSCKRTLRERWKQTIPERKPSWRVFLLTLDDDLSEEKAKEIDQLGIIAYVKDELKSMEYLKNKGWIRKLTDLPKDLGLK
ncbi:MAG: type II restriction endonuclease [Candidatus Bathyarchaeia archaeon]|uniref:type II restriction endonuclease n=1 Tax=Candidatus Hadarchaeum sp. TaxID=2883567 RepID=UPI00317B5FE0